MTTSSVAHLNSAEPIVASVREDRAGDTVKRFGQFDEKEISFELKVRISRPPDVV